MKTIFKRILGIFLLAHILPLIFTLVDNGDSIWYIPYLVGWVVNIIILFILSFAVFIMYLFDQ